VATRKAAGSDEERERDVEKRKKVRGSGKIVEAEERKGRIWRGSEREKKRARAQEREKERKGERGKFDVELSSRPNGSPSLPRSHL